MGSRIIQLILAIVIIGVVVLVIFFHTGDVVFQQMDITIVNSVGENITVDVEIAETSAQHRKGLSGRDSLDEGSGMLFVFSKDVTLSFWMKDTSIPLSIAFIDSDGIIIDIQEMEPYSRESHAPQVPYRYALEVNRDFFTKNHVDIGDMVLIP